MRLAGWGRYPVAECRIAAPRSPDEVTALLRQGNLIARGNGRAYGDAALNPALTVDMRRLDRFVSFDDRTGVLVAEAGVILSDVIAALLPRGWFPSVTPGTRFVTLGGMAAADVHGKNHHRDGSFRNSVHWLDLLGPDGEIRRISPSINGDLFDQTLGGMGLTGVILRLAIQLRKVETGWIRQTTIDAPDLDAALSAFESNHAAQYSVAWIDCLAGGRSLGRSLLMLGEHASLTDLPPDRQRDPLRLTARRRSGIPADLPGIILNRWTVKTFNQLYYYLGRRRGPDLVDWDSYFYPLDAISGWNRIYGRKGFVQLQCVLPLDRSRAGLALLLQHISKAGGGSFLAVLKRLGAQDSAFAFPMEGYTLALDFPATKRCLALVRALVPVVADHGGRFYLAKDAVLSAHDLRRCDPRADNFVRARRLNGSIPAFGSLLSHRLDL